MSFCEAVCSIILKIQQTADRKSPDVWGTSEEYIDGLIIEPSKSGRWSKHRNLYQNLINLKFRMCLFRESLFRNEGETSYSMDDVQVAICNKISVGIRYIKIIFLGVMIYGLETPQGICIGLTGVRHYHADPDDVVWFHTEDRESKACTGMAKAKWYRADSFPDGISSLWHDHCRSGYGRTEKWSRDTGDSFHTVTE